MPIEIKTGDESLDSVLANEKVQTALQEFITKNESGLVSKRDELLATIGEQKKVIEQIKDLGGVEKFNELVSAAQTAQNEAEQARLKEAEKNGDIEALKSAHAEQVKLLNETITTMKSNQVKSELDRQITSAIANAGGIPELLTPVIERRVKGEYKDNGQIAIQVLGANGNPMLTSEGTNSTISDLLNEFKNNEIFASAFKGNGSSGMNTTQSGDVDVSGGVNYFDEKGGNFNLTKAMEIAKTNPEKAKSMAAEAGYDLSRWGL